MSVTRIPRTRRAAADGARADLRRPFRPAFAIVEAKLGPPKPRPGTIERDRLVRLLMGETPSSVVSVIAPPGYGKTTLLAEWAARERRSVAWLTLDRVDNDPAILLSYLAVALDAIEPIDASIATVLSGSGRQVMARAVPRLMREIHDWSRPAVLILDDAHNLVDRACLDALTSIVDHLPPGFRMAIAGRTEPRLPFARLRAQGSLMEIGESLLALDEEEAGALAEAAGARLSPDEVRALTARTEGWAAGTHLALVSLGRADGDAETVDEISGADRYISSYLRSEVEHGLPDQDVTLLTRSSILDTVVPATALAVTGLPRADERLRDLARRSLFIQELGSSGSSYRYHNLLRDFLRAELERREPGAASALHRRAAAWYGAEGSPERAIEHAVAGGDLDFAASMVTSTAVASFYRGHVATLDRWMTSFTPADFERHPPLAVIGAWVSLLTGRPERADRLADIAERSTFDGPPGDGSASFESGRAMLRAVMDRNGPRDVLANAKVAVEQEAPESPWRSNALWSLGSAYALLGEVDAADQVLAEAVTAGMPGATATAIVALAKRASLRIARGDWDGAAEYIGQSRGLLDESPYDELAAFLPVYAISARVALYRGDLERGREELVRAQLVRPLVSYAMPWFSVDALLELGRAYLANSDPTGAQVVVREAERSVRRRPGLGVLVDELIALRRQLSGASATLVGSSSLSTAELRVLPFLPTYLSFQDIADRLMISRNTVKTHAMSIYGKLWASSRGEAVERAVQLGLLEPYPALTTTVRTGERPSDAARNRRDHGPAAEGPEPS